MVLPCGLLAALAVRHRKKRMMPARRYWVCLINLKRQLNGEFHHLVTDMRALEPEKFFKYFRMDCATFDHLLGLIKPLVEKQNCGRDVISAEQRLAVTLRYLATGDSQQTIAFSYRLGKSTVSGIVSQTCAAIWDALNPVYLKPPTELDYRRIAADFESQWQMPHCIGAVDGKHVQVQAPKLSGSTFYNYKHTHSTHLLASCDAQYVFIHVDIGAEGRHSDSGVFHSSAFGRQFEANTVSLPPPETLSESTDPVPYYLIGDEGFPLKSYLMRPYPGRDLTVSRRVYNYRLCRARRCIENAFGICAARWRIFRRPIIAKLDTIDAIVKAICCLHNFLMMSNVQCSRYCPPGFSDGEDRNGNVVPGEWRKVIDDANSSMRPLRRTCSNNYTRNAAKVREELVKYFVSEEGQVSWQLSKISRGCEPDLS